jgi:hypothetical protein
MSGGNNVSNIKSMYKQERRYIDGLQKICNELKDILDQPLRLSEGSIRGLMNYIGDLLDE